MFDLTQTTQYKRLQHFRNQGVRVQRHLLNRRLHRVPPENINRFPYLRWLAALRASLTSSRALRSDGGPLPCLSALHFYGYGKETC